MLLFYLSGGWLLLFHLSDGWFLLFHLSGGWLLLFHLSGEWFLLFHLPGGWYLLFHPSGLMISFFCFTSLVGDFFSFNTLVGGLFCDPVWWVIAFASPLWWMISFVSPLWWVISFVSPLWCLISFVSPVWWVISFVSPLWLLVFFMNSFGFFSRACDLIVSCLYFHGSLLYVFLVSHLCQSLYLIYFFLCMFQQTTALCEVVYFSTVFTSIAIASLCLFSSQFLALVNYLVSASIADSFSSPTPISSRDSNSLKTVSTLQEKLLYFKNGRHKNNSVCLVLCLGVLALIWYLICDKLMWNNQGFGYLIDSVSHQKSCTKTLFYTNCWWTSNPAYFFVGRQLWK